MVAAIASGVLVDDRDGECLATFPAALDGFVHGVAGPILFRKIGDLVEMMILNRAHAS